jgi:hypothetical protein
MPPFQKGAVAQLVEHHVRNVGVTSSSLVRSTILNGLVLNDLQQQHLFQPDLFQLLILSRATKLALTLHPVTNNFRYFDPFTKNYWMALDLKWIEIRVLLIDKRIQEAYVLP